MGESRRSGGRLYPGRPSRSWVARLGGWLCLIAIAGSGLAPWAYQAMIQKAVHARTTSVVTAHGAGRSLARTDAHHGAHSPCHHPGACRHCPLCMLLANQTATPTALTEIPRRFRPPALATSFPPPRAVAPPPPRAAHPLNPRAPPFPV